MATDREILKNQQLGAVVTAPAISDPRTAISEVHEETFVFDLDADASQAERGLPCLKAYKVKSIKLLPSSSLAAHATAYVTYTVQKRPTGDLTTPVEVAAFDTATGGDNVSLTAWTEYELTLSSTTSYLQFAVGDVLTFKSAESSIPTNPIGTVSVTVEYI